MKELTYIKNVMLAMVISFGKYLILDLVLTNIKHISTIELMCFIFIRTRSSIKYLPKLITIANITFLMYVNSFMFGCQYEALGVL